MAASASAVAVIFIGAVLFLCTIHIDAAKVWNNVDNCGKCNRKCPRAPPHSDRTCKSGECGYKCKGTWRDCDSSKRNGCETNVECDARNCGTCWKTCPVPDANSIATCSKGGKCGVKCKRGFAKCGADATGACVNLWNDLNNCGSCGYVCPESPRDDGAGGRGGGRGRGGGGGGGEATCAEGICGLICPDPGYGNCDGILSNGCEADLYFTVGNCGSCSKICPVPTNTEGSDCSLGICGYSACTEGFADCDRVASNGCERKLTGVSVPGTCGTCVSDADCIAVLPYRWCSSGTCTNIITL